MTDDELIEMLARMLHDTAIGCDIHYPPRQWTQDQVHKADAERLIAAMRDAYFAVKQEALPVPRD